MAYWSAPEGVALTRARVEGVQMCGESTGSRWRSWTSAKIDGTIQSSKTVG